MKDSGVKRICINLCIKMQFVFVFPDVTKFSDFQRKNADVSRTQEVRQVIYMFFESSLGMV